MRARRLVTLASALAVGLPLLGVAVPVSAAGSATVELAHGTAPAYPQGLTPLAASSTDIVFARADTGPWFPQPTYWAMPAAGGTATALGFPVSVASTIARRMVAGVDNATATPKTATIYWHNLATGDHGHRSLHAIAATDRLRAFLAPTPKGWLSMVLDAGKQWHLFATTAATGAITQLTAPSPLAKHTPSAVAGPNGVVVTDGTHVYYQPFTGGAPVTLDATGFDNIQCTSATDTVAGCVASDKTTGNGAVLRIPLSGAALQATTDAGDCPNDVSVTADWTGWQDYCDGLFWAEPAAGGTTPISSTYTTQSVKSIGDAFVLGEGPGDGLDPGIWRATDPTTPPTKLRGAAASARENTIAALTAGRVAYGDDRNINYPVFSRTLSTSGPAQVGPESLIAQHATNFGLSISGLRTAYASKAGGSQTLHVVGVGRPATVASGSLVYPPPQLSGNRVLYFTGSNPGQVGAPRIYDARTRTSHQINNVEVSRGTPVINGNYLAYFKGDGSVWRRPLSGPGSAVKVADVVPSGDKKWNGTLFMNGDYVGWSIGWFGNQFGQSDAYRNVRTMAKRTKVGSSDKVRLTGLTSDGALIAKNPAFIPHYFVKRYTSGKLVDTHVIGGNEVAVDQSRLLWIGGDGVGRVRALPHVADVPRFLGEAVAPHRLKTGGGRTWDTYIPTSASLTKCSVHVMSGQVVVRKLGCGKVGRHVGAAIVSWNGKNSAGRLVAEGTYHWVLVARNADGSLRAANGSHHAVGGKVKVVHG